MDVFVVLSIVSRWVHLAAVIVVIGGSFFVRLVLMPAAGAVLSEADHGRLRDRLMPRWARMVHIGLAVLILTGAFNFYMTFADGVKPIPYHPVFGLKLLLVLAVFFLAVALTGSSPGFASLRAKRGKWLAVQLVLAGCVILASGVLKAIHQAAVAAASG